MIGTWIGRLIYFQFFLVSFIVLYTLGLLLVRRFSKRFRQAKIDDYTMALIEEMSLPSAKPKPILASRTIMREVLLTQIKLMRGEEKDFLIKIFKNNGFVEESIKQAYSLSVTKRLNALTDLASLGKSELAPVFFKKIHDSNPLVATVSLIALSELSHPLNSPNLIRSLPEELKKELEIRTNALNELMSNVGIIHGTDPLDWILHYETNPKFVMACIHALRHLQTADSCAVLNSILKKQLPIPSRVISDIIQALRKICDPSSNDVIRPYLGHHNAEVRAESAVFLMLVCDAESEDILEMLTHKPDVELKRLMHKLDLHPVRKAA